MFMDDGAVEELRLQCLAHGECYQALREMARRDHRRAWNVTPKCHKFQHIHVFASIMNPRFVQNYIEESAVGTVQDSWKQSLNGRYKGVVQETVLIKRVTALLLRFEMDST